MRLRCYEEISLELLRAGLWTEDVKFPDNFTDWDKVIQFAKTQSVMGIIAKSVLADKKYLDRIPNDFRLKLKSILVSNVMAFNTMTDVLKKVTKTLDDAGIPNVLLKGHSMAVNYPYPELRQCGDIDLYVGKENSVAAHRALSEISEWIDPEFSATWGKHYSAKVDGIHVEMHRHTCSHSVKKFVKIYNEAEKRGLTQDLGHVTYDGVDIPVPEVNFNAVYIFDHLFKHFLISGIGLRHLSDWMLFLHANKDVLNVEYIKKLLTDLDLLKPWQTFGCVLVKYLGLPHEEFPLYAESDHVDWAFEIVLADGNFGKSTKYYTRRSNSYLMTKFNAIWCHFKRGIQMMRVFPRQEMRHFYYIIVNYFTCLIGEARTKSKK